MSGLHLYSDFPPDIDQSTSESPFPFEKLSGVKARDLAATMSSLIRSGEIAAGNRLPPVRTVANALELSTGSVAAAWLKLRADGLVKTHRRGGTIVSPLTAATSKTAADTFTERDPSTIVDLAHGMTDPDLENEMEAALISGLRSPNLHSPYREFITKKLREAVEPTWPFEPEEWTTLGGGAESTVLALEAAAPRGSSVAIEQPTSPRLLDMLSELGLRPIAVACDKDGPIPEGLIQALDRKPAAFIFRPRAQVPLGISVGPARIKQLADVLAAHSSSAWIIEDDNNGPISMADVHSIGRYLPERVLHIRSFCKTYGIDLRTSVLGGPRQLVERMRKLRSHGYGMTSRICQDALAYLLTSREASRLVDESRFRYARLRQMMADVLRSFGIDCMGADGSLLWVKVPDEAKAIVNLAMLGITVGPGARCYVNPPEEQHIRIATSRLPEDKHHIHKLGEAIAQAITGMPPEEFD
ncbi:MAG TPA: PLP-dependent aminotransferase family protein [Pseudolabrys sp.]|nr:PLP-dependent aminotransferase family protein [Pseudolabrys sp.]